MREGLRFLWGHRLVRTLTLLGFGISFTGGAVTGLTVVYGVQALGLPDSGPGSGCCSRPPPSAASRRAYCCRP